MVLACADTGAMTPLGVCHDVKNKISGRLTVQLLTAQAKTTCCKSAMYHLRIYHFLCKFIFIQVRSCCLIWV
jgi:hypothetical protein